MQLRIKHFSQLSAEELFAIYKARVAVFVVEQHCAYQEVDDFDRQAYHLWLEDNEAIVAYLRVLPAGLVRPEVSLGRVLSLRRHCGMGRRIVSEGIAFAHEHLKAQDIVIEAQTYARKMYESLGFVAESDEFLEDGIEHIRMRLTLDN